jgi:hypothetical protein
MRLFAYLDPGTGSMLLSGLLAGGAAAWVSVKRFGKRIFHTLVFWKEFDDDEDLTQGPASTSAATQHDAEGTATQHETEKEPV